VIDLFVDECPITAKLSQAVTRSTTTAAYSTMCSRTTFARPAFPGQKGKGTSPMKAMYGRQASCFEDENKELQRKMDKSGWVVHGPM
jgi:hypothetical protein